jgi:exonuclease III
MIENADPDSPNILRIFSWNVNGISPFLQKSIKSFFTTPDSPPTYSLRNFLRRHQWPQMLCLQEVKINAKDDATKRALEIAANGSSEKDDVGPGYTAHYCLPKDKFNAKGFGGKVYGVATFIRDDFLRNVEVTREVPWDQEGRVLITELKNKLVVVNGYWVNGTENPYRDPETGVVVGTRHDRKRAFHSLMLEECLAYEAKGWKVVLVGDMNISRGPLDGYPGIRLGANHVKNRADFNSKFFVSDMGLKGVDVFRHLYGETRKYTYYGRNNEWGSSCDRVDLIVVSRSIVETPGLLTESNILNTVEERGHSDHVPLYVTFDLGKVKG